MCVRVRVCAWCLSVCIVYVMYVCMWIPVAILHQSMYSSKKVLIDWILMLQIAWFGWSFFEVLTGWPLLWMIVACMHTLCMLHKGSVTSLISRAFLAGNRQQCLSICVCGRGKQGKEGRRSYFSAIQHAWLFLCRADVVRVPCTVCVSVQPSRLSVYSFIHEPISGHALLDCSNSLQRDCL